MTQTCMYCGIAVYDDPRLPTDGKTICPDCLKQQQQSMATLLERYR